MLFPEMSVRLGNLFPALNTMEGGPDRRDMPSIFKQTIGARLPASWAEVATMTVSDVMAMPTVGRRKVEAFLEYLASLAHVPTADPIHRVVDAAIPLIARIARDGVLRDKRNLAAALMDALSGEGELRAQLERIDLPLITPEDWMAAARRILESLDERETEILTERSLFLSRRPKATLQDLADRYGITRERVRQLERAIEEKVERLADESEGSALSHAGSTIRALGPVFPVSALPIGTEDVAERLILWLTGRFTVEGGWAVSQPFNSVADVGFSKFEEAAENGIATHEELTEAILSAGVSLRFVESVIAALGLDRVGRFLVKPLPTQGARAVQRLRAVGRPMSIDELFRWERPGKNKASFANAVQADEAIVRTGKNLYALREWGGKEYPGIVSAMVERLSDVPSGMDTSLLARDLAAEFGVAEKSVHMYAGMHPTFVSSGGWVRLRRSDEPYVSKERLEETPGCYRVDGAWTLRIPVDADVLRGSGRPIPEAFAVYIGSQPLQTGSIEGSLGRLALGWTMSPTIGSIRREVEVLDLKLGDWVFLRRVGPDKLEFYGLTAEQLKDLRPEARVQRLAGLRDVVTTGWPSVVGEATGLMGAVTATAADLLVHLEKRKDAVLINAMAAGDVPEAH